MQQSEKTTLCRSERGSVTILHHGLAYNFMFKNICLLLAPDEIDAFRQMLEVLGAEDWFLLPDGKFVLLSISRLNASFYLTEDEVREMTALLLETSAMVKVHQCLRHRMSR